MVFFLVLWVPRKWPFRAGMLFLCCCRLGQVRFKGKSHNISTGHALHSDWESNSSRSLGFRCGLGIHVRRALWSRMCISFNNIMPGTAAEQKMSLNFEIWVLFCKMQGVCVVDPSPTPKSPPVSVLFCSLTQPKIAKHCSPQ